MKGASSTFCNIHSGFNLRRNDEDCPGFRVVIEGASSVQQRRFEGSKLDLLRVWDVLPISSNALPASRTVTDLGCHRMTLPCGPFGNHNPEGLCSAFPSIVNTALRPDYAISSRATEANDMTC